MITPVSIKQFLLSLIQRVQPWVLAIRTAVKNARQHRLHGLAAEMAYNWMLAIFPLILTVLTAIGLFTAPETVYEGIMNRLREIAPESAVELVEGYVRAISYGRNGGLFSLSFLITIWAASGAVNAAMIALDLSHGVPRWVQRSMWQRRLIATVMMIGLSVLGGMACAGVFLSGEVLRQIAERANSVGLNPVSFVLLWIWDILDWPIALALITLSCMIVYRYGPSHRKKQIPLLPGGICASLIWLAATSGLRVYVGYSTRHNQIYGTVGAFIVLLLWLWLSSLALLLGEQINIGLDRAKADP